MAMQPTLTVQSLDAAIYRYYIAMGKGEDYMNDDNIGKFQHFCDENGVEDNMLSDQFEPQDNDLNPWDSMFILDFDEQDFPFKTQSNDENERKSEIYELLIKCRDDPHVTFEYVSHNIPTFNKSNFDDADEQSIVDITKRFKDCPKIWNEQMAGDYTLLRLLAVGYNYHPNYAYMQHLFDAYNFDRLQHYKSNPNKPLLPADWKNSCKYLKRLKFSVKLLKHEQQETEQGQKKQKKKGISKTGKDLASAALTSYSHRCTPRLLFNCIHTINDSIQELTKYIDGLTTFISNLIKTKQIDLLPFQLDVCFISGKAGPSNKAQQLAIEQQEDTKEEESSDDPGEEEEEEPLTSQQNASKDDVDYVGKIEAKLKNNQLRYAKAKLNPSNPDHAKSIGKARAFTDLIDAFRSKYEIHGDLQLRDKRWILCIDRRRSKKNTKKSDDLYFYEPPKGPYTQDIPKNAPAEWYVSASRTCLIPKMNYDEDDATGKKSASLDNDGQQKNEDKSQEKNIGATWHCNGEMFTVSFHVKESDQIKCYLYYNGQIIRFMPLEMRTLFEIIFNMNYRDNRDFFDNDPDFDGLMKTMNDKLIDKQFQAFLST